MKILSPDELERALRSSKYKPNDEPRLIGYARVSTEEQNLDMQISQLKKAGVQDDDLYQEHISGAAKKRPRLEAALKACRPGDVLIVWRLDRLSRSLKDTLQRFEWFGENKVGFRSVTEQIDTTTPFGVFYIHLAAALAQLERNLIAFRTKEGVRRRMERGERMGAPRTFTEKDEAEAEKMIRQGISIQQVARRFKVSAQTVYSYFDRVRISELRALGPVRKR